MVLCNEQLHLQKAYSAFFRNPKTGFPKYKSKHKDKKSYVSNNVKLRDKCVYLPKVGNVKAKLHRLPEKNWQLKSGTISQDFDGKYYCSLLFEFEKDIKPIKAQTAIGLDYSSSELYVDCFGNKPDFPKPYRSAQKKLAKEQRRLSHKTKGGKNRVKQKKCVAKVHKKISNQRKNFLHNLSTAIAKHIDKFFLSSKLCSVCNHKKDDLTLSQKTYICNSCGSVLDRDTNPFAIFFAKACVS
jgi:putative transposase